MNLSMKSPNYLYVFLMLALSAVGCKVSKDVVKPTDATPIAYRGANADDSSSIASLSVNAFISTPDIQRLIDTAIAKNYDLQLAIKNIEAADLLFRQSKFGSLPALRLQITANSNRPSDNSLNGLTSNQFLGTSHIED